MAGMYYDIFVLRPNGPVSHNSAWVIERGETIHIDGQKLKIVGATNAVTGGANTSLLCIEQPDDSA